MRQYKHRIFGFGLIVTMVAALVLAACPGGEIANIAPEIAPKEFQAFAGNQSVGLRWKNPEAVTEDNVLWYTIIRNRTDNPDANKAVIIIYGFASQYDDNGYMVGTTPVGVQNDKEYEYSIYVTLTDNSNSPLVGPVKATPSSNKPGAVYDFTATGGDSKVDLSWKPPASGQAPTGYKVYRDGKEVAVVNTTSGTPSYTDSGLTNGDTHEYFITAVNSNGEGAPSETKRATVGGGGSNTSLTPGKPGNFTAIPSGTDVALAWNAPTSGAVPTGYDVYRDGQKITPTNGTTGTTYTDLNPGNGTYTYWVKAKNNAVEGPESDRKTATVNSNNQVTYPSAPTNLTATPKSGQVDLSWGVATSGSPTGYYVWRAPGTGTNGALRIATVPGGSTTSYTDRGLTNGSVYTYWVSAFNAAGDQGPFSNTQTVTVGDPNSGSGGTHTIVTTEPSNFRISVPIAVENNQVKGYQIRLMWDPPSDTGGRTIQGYIVYRGTKRLLSFAEFTSNTNTNATTKSDYEIKRSNGTGTGEYMTTIAKDGPNMTSYIDANKISDGTASTTSGSPNDSIFPYPIPSTGHDDYYVQAVYSNDTRSAKAYYDIKTQEIDDRIEYVRRNSGN